MVSELPRENRNEKRVGAESSRSRLESNRVVAGVTQLTPRNTETWTDASLHKNCTSGAATRARGWISIRQSIRRGTTRYYVEHVLHTYTMCQPV